MATDARELLGLALALASEGDDDERVIDELVEAADGSATALMGAYAFALSLARDLPYDTSNEHTLSVLTRALQRAVRLSGEHHDHDHDGTVGLLRHIEEVAGRAAVRPEAMESRAAEVDADVGSLRGAPPADADTGAGGA